MRVFLATIAAAALSTACLLAPLPAGAAQASPSVAPAAHALTHDDLEAFLDGFFPDAMARADIAGAVVVVVKDGQVLVEKGYGYSDVQTRAPVDPARTLFRPGSISKLFTWTAVMQLVEQGKLNLDRDVNDYLDFKIPDAFGRPITLRNLMTHTGGFEEHIKGLMVDDPARFHTLRDAVVGTTPTRIDPPGEVSAYSNYGAALAGYIVQRVSGEKFEDYVARHIFAPLKMQHSMFAKPLSRALAGNLSKVYFLPERNPQPFEFISFSPAGGLSATADDIAHFMIAHLNHGAYDGAAILKAQTADLMHGNAFTPTPPLPSMGLGFYHEDRNGLTIVGHGGDSQVFHSDLFLILERNVGLYVSLNSLGREASPVSGLRPFLREHFVDRYFPAPAPSTAVPLATAAADAAKLAGEYIISRRSESNFASVQSLVVPIMITAGKDGTISFPTLAAIGIAGKWIEVAPFVWREEHGSHRFVARVENGQVRWVSSDLFPPILVLQPVSFWRSFLFVLPLFVASLLMLTLTALFWPIKAVLRWRYSQPMALGRRDTMLYRLTRVVAWIYVATFAGWAWFLVSAQLSLAVFDSPSDPLVRVLQLLSVIAIAGTIIPILEFVAALRDRERPWWTKATDGFIVVACIVLATFLISYNFITLSLNY
jgi:CubicO group peptidase (beta-lactamase class C family)